jgi:hypothetical protein
MECEAILHYFFTVLMPPLGLGGHFVSWISLANASQAASSMP